MDTLNILFPPPLENKKVSKKCLPSSPPPSQVILRPKKAQNTRTVWTGATVSTALTKINIANHLEKQFGSGNVWMNRFNKKQ